MFSRAEDDEAEWVMPPPPQGNAGYVSPWDDYASYRSDEHDDAWAQEIAEGVQRSSKTAAVSLIAMILAGMHRHDWFYGPFAWHGDVWDELRELVEMGHVEVALRVSAAAKGRQAVRRASDGPTPEARSLAS